MDQSRLLTLEEVADYLNVSIATVRSWRATGRGEGRGPKGIKVGRHVRVRPADLESWLNRRSDSSDLPAA